MSRTRFGFLAALLLLCGSVWAQEDGRAVPPPTEIPMGVLGHRLGSLLTIEGIRATGLKSGNQTLMVETINGQRLKDPVAIWIEHDPGLPADKRIILRGYETGKWIGTPDEVIEAYPERGMPQFAWHFFRSFIVVVPIAPEVLEDESPNRPTL